MKVQSSWDHFWNGPNKVGIVCFLLSGFLIYLEFQPKSIAPLWIVLPPTLLFLSVNFSNLLWRKSGYDSAQHKDYGDMIYYIGFFTSIASLGWALLEMKAGKDFVPLMYKFGIGLLVTGTCMILRIFTIETAESIEESIKEKNPADNSSQDLHDLIKKESEARKNLLDDMKNSSVDLLESLRKSTSDISDQGLKTNEILATKYNDLYLMAESYKRSLESLKQESDNVLIKMQDSSAAPKDLNLSLSQASEKIKELSKHIDNFGASLKTVSRKIEEPTQSSSRKTEESTQSSTQEPQSGGFIVQVFLAMIALFILFQLAKSS